MEAGAPANQGARLGRLKHSPPLHATHLIVGWLYFERAFRTTNKMADERFWWQVYFFQSLVPLAAAFQCLGLLFCTPLLERSHQRQVAREGGLPCPARKRFNAFSK